MVDILLVEDNLRFRQMIKQNLEEYFPYLTIEEAGDGREALTKCERFLPKLIIMDIHLPGELGLSLTEKIKTRYCGTKVAVLTSYDLPEYREVALLAGADYFFTKGELPWETMLGLVNEICNRQDGVEEKNESLGRR